MSREIIDLRIKQVEKAIPGIGARIAEAMALLKADDAAVVPLIEAQLALEELYLFVRGL
ncbi:MAG: hypothetical protein FWE08_04395 [Oscillospiraceae bacterium]|nr:hypothetical protein [Oscillospiraceae bacterium]